MKKLFATFIAVTLLLALPLTLMPPVSAPNGEIYDLILKWGSYGMGDGQFLFPDGIAVDSNDNVYVIDVGIDRVQKFTSSGTFLTRWRPNFPAGIAVDSSGKVYVTDIGNHRVQKFGLANVPPLADFTWSPTSPRVNKEIAFTDTSTDADGSVVSWSWTFGDEGTSSLQHPRYTHTAEGTYTVNLTVTDDDGHTHSTSYQIEVRTRAPENNIAGIVILFIIIILLIIIPPIGSYRAHKLFRQ